MNKIRKYVNLHGISGFLFIYAAINFLMLLYNLIFSDGAKAWEYFGKGSVMVFIGLIILAVTDPKEKNPS